MSAKSASRALDVLEFLSRRTEPAPAAIIGLSCGIPKSSLHNLLNLLKVRRFATYHPREHAWGLGPRVFELSADAPLFAHALAVLKAFPSASQSLTLREIAALAELPSSVVARIVPLMEQSDLLTAQPDGAFSLGLELVSLAARLPWVDHLRVTARPFLVWLRDTTGETANLAVLDRDQALYVDQVESHHALRYSGWVGRRVPLAGTATGAAFYDPSEPHVIADAVEVGVTAIACGVAGTSPPVAVSILAPSSRIEQFGIDRAAQVVGNLARQVAERLTEASSAGRRGDPSGASGGHR